MLTRAAIATAVALGLMVGGCAQSLADSEAEAFAKLATANRDAFDNLVDQEATSSLAFSQIVVRENLGRIQTDGCEAGATTPCVLTYTVPGHGSQRAVSPDYASALIGGIARYGGQMAKLAKAEDLDDLKAKSDGAVTSLKALAALAPPPVGVIAAPIVDAIATAGNAQLRVKRRRAMLKIADAAQPIIARAALALGDEARSFQAKISTDAAASVLMTQKAVLENQAREQALLRGRRPGQLSVRQRAELDALRDRRATDVATLDQQARSLTNARRLPVDYSSLTEGHATLVAALRKPKVSNAEAIAQMDQFLDLLAEVKAARGT